jgi:hypothetical protein
MKLVRLLALVPVATAAAVVAMPTEKIPSGNDLRDMMMQVVGPRVEESDPPATPAWIRRVSLDGRYYGECRGWVSTVLLKPDPCDALWQRLPDPIQLIRPRPASPSPARSD